MIVVDIPREFERPRHLVMAFMAGLSMAAGVSGRSYFEQLVLMLPTLSGDKA